MNSTVERAREIVTRLYERNYLVSWSDLDREVVFVIQALNAEVQRLEALAQPEPKPDLNYYYHIDNENHVTTFPATPFRPNLKLTFDGETRKLKSAEVIA